MENYYGIGIIDLKGKIRRELFSNDVNVIVDELSNDEDYKHLEIGSLYEMANDMLFTDYEELKHLLDIDLDGEIVLMGRLVRWNGPISLIKECHTRNLGEAIDAAYHSFDGDNRITFFIQNGELMMEQYGHDNPCSPSLFKIRSVKVVKRYNIKDADIHLTM